MKFNSIAVSLVTFLTYSFIICTTTEDWHFLGQNIALGKRAVQRPGSFIDAGSPREEGYTASLAVDGDDSSDFIKGSCTFTNGSVFLNYNQYIAQWLVELGWDYYVTGIVITNRIMVRYRLKGFYVVGYNKQLCPAKGGNWCLIYNDSSNEAYIQDKIKIIADPVRPFSKIAINLPGPPNRPTYLTLCEVKVYAAGCGNIPLTNGEMNPKKTLYEVNSNATVVCKEGYQTNSTIVSCVHNRNTIGWNNPPKCSPVHCIYPEKPVNGYYLINTVGMVFKSNSSLPFGSSITGLCDVGYENQKSALRICQSNKQWSGSQPVCEKKQCPYPEHIPNGEYSFENGSMYGNGPSYYNTTINVKCKKGYTLYGDGELFCNDIKIWVGNPSCHINTCKAPTVPENTLYLEKEANDSFLQYNSGQFSYLDKVQVVCRIGYINNAPIKFKKCLENKTWSGDFGNCTVVTCNELADLADGFYNYSIDKFSNGYPYNTIVTATCKEPFQLLNPRSKNRICNANGEWDNEPAMCITSDVASDEDLNVAFIGGVSASAVVVTIFIMLLVVFFLYRRKNANTNTANTDTGNDNNGGIDQYETLQTRNNSSHEGLYSDIQEVTLNNLDENKSFQEMDQREDTNATSLGN